VWHQFSSKQGEENIFRNICFALKSGNLLLKLLDRNPDAVTIFSLN
jgi:hypothetical protein